MPSALILGTHCKTAGATDCERREGNKSAVSLLWACVTGRRNERLPPFNMSHRPKVVVTDFITEPLEHERRILGDVAEVVALNAFSEDDLVGRIEDAHAIMLYHFITITARTIQRLEKCKLIVRCGVGYDNVEREAARARGINVANVPDYGTEDVADSAIGMALTLARGIHYL